MEIYLAKVKVKIKRCIKKDKFQPEEKTVEMVYKEGAEKIKDSHFLCSLEKYIDIRYDKKEDYKILEITKIKTIGL